MTMIRSGRPGEFDVRSLRRAHSAIANTEPANGAATGLYTPPTGADGSSAPGAWSWPLGGNQAGLSACIQESGTGSPIIFLHGLVGLNEHWEGVVDRVSEQMRCLLVELPLLQLRGSECSIHGATTYAVKFLRERMGKPVVLVGNSFGGHVALRVALEYPELVAGLVLAGSSGLIEKSIVSDVQIRPSREWLSRKIGELFYDQSFMKQSDLDRAHAELSNRGGARAMIKLSRSARRDHLGDRISEIQVPTLLIWGRQDIVTPPEAAEGFHRMIHGSKLVWLDKCGHAPMIEQPDAFARVVLEFCESPGVRGRLAAGGPSAAPAAGTGNGTHTP